MKLVLELTDAGRIDLSKEIGPMMFDETFGAKDKVKDVLNTKTFSVHEVLMTSTTVTLKLQVQ